MPRDLVQVSWDHPDKGRLSEVLCPRHARHRAVVFHALGIEGLASPISDGVCLSCAHDDLLDALESLAAPTIGGDGADERQVDAALAVLREEFDIGFDVPIGDYITSRTDPPPGPVRDAALAEYRAANEAAEQRVRAVIRRALKAASRRD